MRDAAELPPLTSEEAELARGLRTDVAKLSQEFGERNSGSIWTLAAVADYLNERLSSEGFAVRRLGYEHEYKAYQNLEFDVPGGRWGDRCVLVGAHYDTAAGSPGADDNASGVAAVLALAKHFRGQRRRRTIRFVLFANEEPPFFQTPQMGSVVYVKQAVAAGDQIDAMVSIDSVGYFSSKEGSQKYPAALDGVYPNAGNFVAVVGRSDGIDLVEKARAGFAAKASIPVISGALPQTMKGVGWSDHWAFWQHGIPAILVTDTAVLRNPHYHRSTDKVEHLDFQSMARAVVGLQGLVAALAGPPSKVTAE